MKTKNLREAIEEAERFIKRAKALEDAAYGEGGKVPDVLYSYSTEKAAVKRSSMDLSRALSKLRNDKE